MIDSGTVTQESFSFTILLLSYTTLTNTCLSYISRKENIAHVTTYCHLLKVEMLY